MATMLPHLLACCNFVAVSQARRRWMLSSYQEVGARKAGFGEVQ